jgi:hypothetical protein
VVWAARAIDDGDALPVQQRNGTKNACSVEFFALTGDTVKATTAGRGR